MKAFIPPTRKIHDRGVALVIVLAFVVLLTGLVVAYLSRTSTDRQLAHGTFSENRADLLARSALDVVVGDLKQEIVAGSNVTTVNNINIDLPSSAAGMIPARSGNPSGSPDPVPNLVRRSWANDTNLGVRSRASGVNSTTDVSLNGRSVTPARWNSHYLVQPANPSSTPADSTPIATFTTPDWVLVTNAGPQVQTSPSTSVVGRYGYAIYDEGGLLDVNVAGYPIPTPTPAPSPAPAYVLKGSLAYADLTALPTSTATPAPSFPPSQVNNIVGWRNYASTQPGGDFQSSFTFNTTSAQNFFTLVANNTGFLTVPGTTWNGRTDQAFLTRQQLLSFRSSTGFSQNVLQYLGTFSRELNRPTWKPYKPTGSTIDYPTLSTTPTSETSTAINRDLSAVRVTGAFPRADGTQAVAGEPLLKTRFALTRINELTNAANASIQRDFGLKWNAGQNHWDYVGATGSTVQTTIKRLDQVAAENREPNFFELLKAVILRGSVGLGSGSANTFVASEQQYYITGTTPSNLLSADYQIMQIGANIIDAWDSDNIPTFIGFGLDPSTSKPYELAGIENLPYLNKLVFAPYFTNHGQGDQFYAWLVPSFWNPHQNASSAAGTVRIAMTSGSTTATIVDNKGKQFVSGPVTGSSPSPPYIQVRASAFGQPHPVSPGGSEEVGTSGSPVVQSTFMQSNNYEGFFYPFTYPDPNGIDDKSADHAFPSFTGGVTFEMQAQVQTAPSPTPPPTPAPSPSPTPPHPSPYITNQPADQTVTVGQTATFSVTAGGSAPLSYQWRKNGTNIAGATSASYTTPATALSDDGSLFSVVVSNGSGTLPSNNATLRIVNIFVWKTYQRWKGCTQSATPLACTDPKGAGGWKNNKLIDPEFVSLDPRTLRFGVWGSDASDTGKKKGDFQDGAEDSIDQSGILELIYALKPQPAASFPSSGTAYYRYAANSVAGDQYADLDSVVRQGDWAADGIGTASHKTVMFGPTLTDRPQMLSTAFRSVAELGQVFRDQPWKTLNFTIGNSGDAGLLDAFTLQDNVPVAAGKTSLNTRQFPVLTAILSQAAVRLDGSSILNATQAANVAKAVVGITATNPLISKGDLIAQIATTSSFTGLGNKEARECVIRALSDACQTRTWNLMIDVIAQSGRYPSTATGLSKFVVEGEKRYWLHIAIDRFTGEIIDQQLEAVYE